ncbi:MAG: hypothetical protein P8013_08400 [Candidatus Sulfobium sp.]|jgi:hypothetical protein
MPIHLDDTDIVSEVDGLSSALIVACNMCAGASFAMKENKPFLQPFGSLLKSPPLKRHIKRLQSQLGEKGLKTRWFRAGIIQQFFLCLWTSRQRGKFQESARQYEAVIVLGCDSAFKTIRDSLQGVDCTMIEGTKVAGIMNTKPKLHFPFNISFEGSKIVHACDRNCEHFTHESQYEHLENKE